MKELIKELETEAAVIAQQAKDSDDRDFRRELHRQYDYIQDKILMLKGDANKPDKFAALKEKILNLPREERLKLLQILWESFPKPKEDSDIAW